MAEITDMWYYVRNIETGPVLEATDELFEERFGMLRSEALAQFPAGGEWVDTWLAALQETGDKYKGNYYHYLTGVMFGLPDEHGFHGISEIEWRDLHRQVMTLHNEVREALDAWQFVTARTQVSRLWDVMVEMYPHSNEAAESDTTIEHGWIDLRPLFQ